MEEMKTIPTLLTISQQGCPRVVLKLFPQTYPRKCFMVRDNVMYTIRSLVGRVIMIDVRKRIDDLSASTVKWSFFRTPFLLLFLQEFQSRSQDRAPSATILSPNLDGNQAVVEGYTEDKQIATSAFKA